MNPPARSGSRCKETQHTMNRKILDLDAEFLSLNKAPSDALRLSVQDFGLDVASLCRILIPAINAGVITDTVNLNMGTRVSISTTIKTNLIDVACWIHLIRSGKLAPDGRKYITFFAGFYPRSIRKKLKT